MWLVWLVAYCHSSESSNYLRYSSWRLSGRVEEREVTVLEAYPGTEAQRRHQNKQGEAKQARYYAPAPITATEYKNSTNTFLIVNIIVSVLYFLKI